MPPIALQKHIPKPPGLKPAGRVIDFRKEKSVKTSHETVKIACGLCQFPFERITNPVHLILVCPSCGIRFEHRLPKPEPQSPNPLKTTLETALSQNLQTGVFVIEEVFETDQPLAAVGTVESLHTDTEFSQEDTADHQVFVPITSTEQLNFGPAYDSQIDFGKKNQLPPPDTQEIQQGAQWITPLITIAQAVLIAVALIWLVNGMNLSVHKEVNFAASDSYKNEPAPANSAYPVKTEEINANTVVVTTNIGLQSLFEPMQTAVPEPGRKVEQPDDEQYALLFEIDDFVFSPDDQSRQKSVPAEHLRESDGWESKTELVTISLGTESIASEAETEEVDFWQQMQLQAKLAATEKQVQALLQEQEEIQTQSKRLVSETLLRESAITLERNPARSLFLSLKSIQILQELGLQISDWGKTILGQAYAAQSTGEYFIEQIPGIEAQSVSSNGKWLLTSHSDRSLWLWDFSKSGKKDRKDKGFQIDVSSVPVIDLLITPNEHWLIGARADGFIELWDMTIDWPSEATVVLREQIPQLSHIQISPDGRWLVAYGRPSRESSKNNSVQQELTATNPFDGNGVWIWDMNNFKQDNIPRSIVLRGHERPVRCVAISPDSRWLATGSEDRSVRVYDLKSPFPGGNQKVLLGHQLEITDLQFAPGGRWIVTGSRDNTARIWDLQSETATPTARILKGHNGWVSSLAFSADGEWFATAGYDQTVRLWNAPAILSGSCDKELFLIVPEQGTVQKVAFTPDSGSLLTYGINRSLKIWNLATEPIADHALEIHSPISSFSFGENGRWLVLSGNQGKQSFISLWPLEFEDMVQQATRFKEAALPNELQEREETYAKQFEQRIIR